MTIGKSTLDFRRLDPRDPIGRKVGPPRVENVICRTYNLKCTRDLGTWRSFALLF